MQPAFYKPFLRIKLLKAQPTNLCVNIFKFVTSDGGGIIITVCRLEENTTTPGFQNIVFV